MRLSACVTHGAMLLQTLPTVVADDFDEGEIRDCDSESEAPTIAMDEADIGVGGTDGDGPSLVDTAADGQSIRCAKGLFVNQFGGAQVTSWTCRPGWQPASLRTEDPQHVSSINMLQLAGPLQREAICDAQD